MRLRQLFESPATAVMAFGRMNPPTIGHKKLVDKIKSLPGDPYIFLSQSQKPKTDPLSFQDKLRYAKFFFPEVTIGNPEVKTIIQALQKVNQLGYKNLIYVAGSDRIAAFEEMINKYNGQPDKDGNVAYNFDTIEVVSAGERDPDADGAEGMSASKMRAAAAAGDIESFKQGVPNQEVADEMFAAVRQGMGVKDAVSAEGVAEDASEDEEDEFHRKLDKLVHKTFGHSSDEKKMKKSKKMSEQTYDRNQLMAIVTSGGERKEYNLTGRFQGDKRSQMQQADRFVEQYLRKHNVSNWNIEIHFQGAVLKNDALGQSNGGADDLDNFANQARQRQQQMPRVEAAYEGNIGLIELFKFFNKAEKTDPKLVAKVKQLIKQGEDRAVWKIVQDYTGTKLIGKEFEGSIRESITKEANHGRYWCSTDKKWKYRKGPKQSRSS